MKKFQKVLMVVFSLMLSFTVFTACSGGDTSAVPVTDAQSVSQDKDALDVTDFTFSGSDSATSVTGNITLPISLRVISHFF